jgi:hypothetical protein
MLRTIVSAVVLSAVSLPPAVAGTLDSDRSRMDKMIAKANATSVFANETKQDGVLIARHKPTNVTCLFFEGLGELSYDATAHAAMCTMRRSTYGYALAIFPAIGTDPVDPLLDQAVSEVAKGRTTRNIDLSKVDTLLDSDSKLPKSKTRRFQVGSAFWRISFAHVGDWIVMMETSSPIENNAMTDVQQGLDWRNTLTEIQTTAAAAQ